MDSQKVVDPFLKETIEWLDQFSPGLWQNLDKVLELGDDKAKLILKSFLECSCQSQNMQTILIGRRGVLSMPSKWVRDNLPNCVEQQLDLKDYWQYRRLLELCDAFDGSLLKHYVALGIKSDIDDIKEAANDFHA